MAQRKTRPWATLSTVHHYTVTALGMNLGLRRGKLATDILCYDSLDTSYFVMRQQIHIYN